MQGVEPEARDEAPAPSSPEMQAPSEPLNVRILHSLEETINQVKDAVTGQNSAGDSPDSKGILQSMEDKIVESVQSVEETLVNSVQSMKNAVNGATEAARTSAGAASAPSMPTDESSKLTEVDEAAILVNSVIQD